MFVFQLRIRRPSIETGIVDVIVNRVAVVVWLRTTSRVLIGYRRVSCLSPPSSTGHLTHRRDKPFVGISHTHMPCRRLQLFLQLFPLQNTVDDDDHKHSHNDASHSHAHADVDVDARVAFFVVILLQLSGISVMLDGSRRRSDVVNAARSWSHRTVAVHGASF